MRFLAASGLILILMPTVALSTQGSSTDQSPSPILVQKALAGIVKILEKRDPQTPIELLPILALTTKTLNIELREDEIQQAQKDWETFLQEQGDMLHADSPERQARRILIWELQWLYRQGLKIR
jgi:hypothetical protein